ncbi:MAG: HlyU family transcriptional regulator [Pseudomonadota bacterium]
MSLFKRLFGGGAAPEAAAEDYKGYRITPTPIAEGQQYRLSARVEKEVGDETKTHNLVRADTVAGLEAAQAASVEKAQQVIDALGDGIFK